MSGLDWSVLVAYAAAILSVAFYFRRRASRGVEDFFVAGRNLPWWVIGFADVAGYTGGGQAFVMVFFLGGFSGLWLMAWMSWAIWMPLVAVLWAPMWSRLGLVTTGEFISHRYAGRRAAVYRQVYGLYASLAWGVTVLDLNYLWRYDDSLLPSFRATSGGIQRRAAVCDSARRKLRFRMASDFTGWRFHGSRAPH
jgi:SSS family solute:Na+ symporter